MKPPAAGPCLDAALADLAAEILKELAHRFPVCTYSDEFHFFPQVGGDERQPAWDDFSFEAVSESVSKLRGWKSALNQIDGGNLSPEARIDAAMLGRILTTLHEQFETVRAHETQPSFHLTVMAIGLADALEAGEAAWKRRIMALPLFLDRAVQSMTRIPALFRELGVEMAVRLGGWLQSLDAAGKPGVGAAAEALQRFAHALDRIPGDGEFRLAPDIYARVAAAHIGCRLPTDAIAERLDAEIEETRRLLLDESLRMGAGRNWPAAYAALPVPESSAPDAYQQTIAALGAHCRQQGLVDDALLSSCPVAIRSVPHHLRPVRSTAAYAMAPVHPPRGGCFYTGTDEGSAPAPPDWRQLCAHETFPGHHLLDTRRWNHGRPLRRHIEFPLFYEGWASFAEELLFDTGFFEGPADRLCMAKRRFWRALRGRADLDLQAGRRTLQQVAARFTAEGLDPARAEARVRRYALKPGYQLCYTIGRGRFRVMYDRHAGLGRSPAAFAQTVLAQGEIGLEALEKVLFDFDRPQDPGRQEPEIRSGTIREQR